MLRSGNHHSRHLQHSFRKHGEVAFEMRPLEIVADAGQLIAREQSWMDATSRRMLYNRSKVAGRNGKKVKPVYSVNPKTGEMQRYESTIVAAIAIHESRDALTLINKAIRKFAISGGLFWTHKKDATIEGIEAGNAAIHRKQRERMPFCVFSFDTGGTIVGEYRSVADAARDTGVSATQISSAMLSSKYRTAAGLTWSELRIPKSARSKKTKAVLQIKAGEIIQRWASCIEAANAVDGANYKGVSSAATGYTKSHRGFQWVFDKN